MQKIREVIFYKTYFHQFYSEQNKRVQDKIDWLIELVESYQHLSSKHLKSIRNSKGLFELRIMLGTNCWRIFCFFDDGNIVVLLNGFVKKDQKTPMREIEKAKLLMHKYYEERKR
jgi:phage-related protein